MQIQEVKTQHQQRSFLKVPKRIYRNDPHWIPHLRQDIEKVFDPKTNKFFRHGEVTRWVLFDANNKPIGRVAAFINRKTADTFDYPTGGMGFFECIDDQDAANLLFETCQAWLQERGMEAMEGPVNFGEKDKYWGLMIENFEAPGYYQQNYNPEYYVKLFENYGWKTYYEQLIFYRDMRNDGLPQRFFDSAERLSRDPKYTVRTVNRKELSKYAEDFRTIYNRAWGHSHRNFTELSLAKAKLAMKSMKPILDEDLTYFVYYGERPIGFFIAMPNVNEIFRKVNGNFNWWGKLKFVYYRWRGISKTCIGIVYGTDPDFHGKGTEGLIFKKMEKLIYQTQKYHHIYIAWIGDFNPKMIKIIKGIEVKLFRKLATKMKIFDESKPFKRRPIN